MTATWPGLAALLVFVVAYVIAASEERLQVRKSVPVLLAAGLVWILVGIAYSDAGNTAHVAEAARETLLDFAEVMLFVVAAMTYVNTLEERGAFDALRAWLIRRRLSLRAVFWATGGLAFLISPVCDNMTTALLMGGVAIAVGRGEPRFVSLACINVVVAANASGAFSPFGDITTLMVWQAGFVPFEGFFPLALPALVNWLLPAVLMAWAVPDGHPVGEAAAVPLQSGTLPTIVLFAITIALTVVLHSSLHLPPALGMMLGLGLLKVYSYVHNRGRAHREEPDEPDDVFAEPQLEPQANGPAWLQPTGAASVTTILAAPPSASVAVAGAGQARHLDIFRMLERLEWDTLMFFYGVILCVGGLGALGYLALTSTVLYSSLGATTAHVMIGILSAVVDNVPVMFAVLTMAPELSQGQWLLVTLTTGVGGSLLSIGSAAGVALMGQARGAYTFMAHLRWTWAVALGYAASIVVHVFVNAALF